MLVAVSRMSEGTQAIIYFIALVAFVVAAVYAWISRTVWAALVALGAALWTFVAFWNVLALS